jgi:hypothetical protein
MLRSHARSPTRLLAMVMGLWHLRHRHTLIRQCSARKAKGGGLKSPSLWPASESRNDILAISFADDKQKSGK